MRKLLLLCCFALTATFSFAQITAVTSNGDEVVLNPDGTWKYVNGNSLSQNKIDTSKLNFSKSLNSSFVVKSNKVNCGVYIDPKKWSFKKSTKNEAAEFEFELKEKDAYGMMITEKIEIPLESLGAIAFDNAKASAPDITITKQEYRKVNDNIVLLIQMSGTLKGIKFTYFGYYFSSPKGSVQLVTYSSTNLFVEYKADLEQLLNGFVVSKD